MLRKTETFVQSRHQPSLTSQPSQSSCTSAAFCCTGTAPPIIGMSGRGVGGGGVGKPKDFFVLTGPSAPSSGQTWHFLCGVEQRECAGRAGIGRQGRLATSREGRGKSTLPQLDSKLGKTPVFRRISIWLFRQKCL